MSQGYVYIASNPSLKGNLLKIGLTHEKPEKRIDSLSRSTSIPEDFILDHYKEVDDADAAESRIHLLLADYRLNSSKEFFSIGLRDAKLIVDRVAYYLEVHEYYSERIGFSDEYLLGNFEGSLSTTPYRYMYLLASLSIGQHLADHLMGFSDDVVSGFASSEFCAKQFGTTRSSAMTFMQSFCNKYEGCVFVTGSKKRIKVFNFLRYHRGHMAWKYSDDFRPLVQNEKI
ncbi:GIY-YIG nuclease family protein [Halomonas sp. N3-2A]|uniref:GIY-YIG nuclease family protein n=1 Tax=Halomonas sp. N3-2A TaxID=2014541 RepID=UPI000B5B2490|nr:GIY-YIG nuclease family protein [Halomonas sp. N3-2A]ASK18618.1 hypothetical protein CEK60_04545 [Halomonas sp. N3-2A]